VNYEKSPRASAFKLPKTYLDEVSTTRDSGWVAGLLGHPVINGPTCYREVVLTSSNNDYEEMDMTDDLYAFLSALVRFKEEIEDRIPEYFSCHHLNLFQTETAELSHYFAAIATVLGINIRPVSAMEDLNPIEEVLHYRLMALHSENITSDSDAEQIVRTFLNEYNRIKCEQLAQAQQAIEALRKKTISLPQNLNLNYYVGGAGENTIVIVNAFGQSLDYWTMLIANLVKSHRVIIWLPRGNEDFRGGSFQANPMTVHVEDIKTMLRHEEVDACDFVGWCTGPKLMIEFQAKYPEYVSSMTFLCPTFKSIPGKQNLESPFESNLDPLLRMVDNMPRLAKPLSSSLQSTLLAPKAHVSSVAVHDPRARKQTADMLSFVHGSLRSLIVEPFATEQSVVNYAKQLVTFWAGDVSPMLEKIDVPVVFVGGEYDGIASPQLAKIMFQQIRGAKYLEIKGGSHYLQYEDSELITHIINRFLNEKWTLNFGHPLVNQTSSTADFSGQATIPLKSEIAVGRGQYHPAIAGGSPSLSAVS
jgi:pimeloyl-ACP methyl ester carboxylesterase